MELGLIAGNSQESGYFQKYHSAVLLLDLFPDKHLHYSIKKIIFKTKLLSNTITISIIFTSQLLSNHTRLCCEISIKSKVVWLVIKIGQKFERLP